MTYVWLLCLTAAPLAGAPVTAGGQVVHQTVAQLGPYDQAIVPVPVQWPLALKASDLPAVKAGTLRTRVYELSDPKAPVEIPASLRCRTPGFDTKEFPAEALWTLRRALPKKQVRRYRIVVERVGTPRPPAQPPEGDLVVEKTAKAIAVENSVLRVTHSGPTLILDVVFKSTKGKHRIATNNDVHGPYGQGRQNESFRWRLDEPGGLRVLEQSPAQVRVEARGTFKGSVALPTRPRATFTFTYRNHSPLVRVDVRWQHDRPFDYALVRLFQWSGAHKRFPMYACGGAREKPTRHKIADCHGVVKGDDWMAVYNDQDMLGFWFGRYSRSIPINAFLYAHGAGFYMIANWTGRGGTQPTDVGMTFDLYVGPAGKDGDRLANYAASFSRTASAFYDTKIRELLQDL